MVTPTKSRSARPPRVAESDPERCWREFVRSVFDGRALSMRVCERILGELPSYQVLTVEAIASGPVQDMIVRGIADARSPSAEDCERWKAHGEMRAIQGVSAIEMLQVFRIYHEEIRRRAFAAAPAGPERDGLLLKLFTLVSEWNDMGMIAASDGHASVESELGRQSDQWKVDLVQRALFGSRCASDVQLDCHTLGIETTSGFHAVRARPTLDVPAREIETYLETAGIRPRNGVIALVDGDLCGFLFRLPAGPPPVPVGVSSKVQLGDLPTAFGSATRAHATAVALGERRLCELSSLGLHPAVISDHQVGDALIHRYVEPFVEMGDSGWRILETVERYIANDLKLERTATDLFVHVNTVRYRVGRFEHLTHCHLRRTGDLTEVWWALARRRIAIRDDIGGAAAAPAKLGQPS